MNVFVTGASGWIGSAVVPELMSAGHTVTGLARSDASVAALAAAGATALRGSLDDVHELRDAAAASDGIIHLAFKHDLVFSGQPDGAVEADRRAIETMGEALAGTGKPFVIASGTLGVTPGRVATERDKPTAAVRGGLLARHANAEAALALASRGVRASVVRLPPTVHGRGDQAFVPMLIRLARETGVSGYVGDGTNRWPAVHRFDAATAFRLALERAPAGSIVHAVADEGVPTRDIAEVIGRHLNLPVRSITVDEAGAHFTWLAGFFGADGPTSSTLTRELLGWYASHPGLIDDLEAGHYFSNTTAAETTASA